MTEFEAFVSKLKEAKILTQAALDAWNVFAEDGKRRNVDSDLENFLLVANDATNRTLLLVQERYDKMKAR